MLAASGDVRVAWPGAGARRTVRGPPEVLSVTVALVPPSSRYMGGSSATPCEPSVRRRSTGSPPAPRSGMRVTGFMRR